MPTKKKYRLKVGIKKIAFVYLVICALVLTGHSLSRYSDFTMGNSSMDIADFHVLVNGINAIDGETFDLKLSPTTNTQNNKILPDTEGYFEIEINPAGTEVGLDYEFAFHLEELDESFTLTKFLLNDETETPIENNLVQGSLLLPSQTEGFKETDTLNIKVYWRWNQPEEKVNPVITGTTLRVSSTIKQRLD